MCSGGKVVDVCLDVNLGSSVRPKICGCMFMGSVVLCVLRPSCVQYYAGCGVNRVQVVLSVFRKRLLVIVQVCMSCKSMAICYF